MWIGTQRPPPWQDKQEPSPDETEPGEPAGAAPAGVIWLGILGAVLGLLAAAGVWAYALLRPWFQPWDEPWGGLLMLVAPYPAALAVALAGKSHRLLAGLALAGCAILSAFVVGIGRVGMLFLPGVLFVPATLLLLFAAVLVLTDRWSLWTPPTLAGTILTLGAVSTMLSAADTLFHKPQNPSCVLYWQLMDGRVLWRPWNHEPLLDTHNTPEGPRDDVRTVGQICDLNPLTRREAVFGLAQMIAASIALLAVPLSARGPVFLALIGVSLLLAIGAAVVQPWVLLAAALVSGGAALVLYARRKQTGRSSSTLYSGRT